MKPRCRLRLSLGDVLLSLSNLSRFVSLADDSASNTKKIGRRIGTVQSQTLLTGFETVTYDLRLIEPDAVTGECDSTYSECDPGITHSPP